MPPVSMMGLPGPSSQPDSLTGLGGLSGGKTNVIMFDQTKNPVGGRPPTDLGMLCGPQVYKLTEGFRSLHRKLKANWKVLSNQGEAGVTQETLSQVI